MLTFKKIADCTFEEAVRIWNEGFKGYFVDINMTVDMFIQRMAQEGLSSRLSLVAHVNGEPAGIVLNGIREINGKKVAWNGGTGVAPNFRGQGIGKALIKEALDLYVAEGVEVATLEAIGRNETAIALYEKMGYEIVDRLLFLHREGTFEQNLFSFEQNHSYHIRRGTANDVRVLPMYTGMVPWQSQVQSLKDGESVIVSNLSGEAVGYALYKRTFDGEGKQTGTLLFQCEAIEDGENREAIARLLLVEVFSLQEGNWRRGTFNFPESNELVVSLMKQEGFTLRDEQVFMVKKLERK